MNTTFINDNERRYKSKWLLKDDPHSWKIFKPALSNRSTFLDKFIDEKTDKKSDKKTEEKAEEKID